MTVFDEKNKSHVNAFEISVYITADAFATNRVVFEAAFFTTETQRIARNWFEREIYRDEYPRVPGLDKIESFLNSVPQDKGIRAALADWLNRGASFKESGLKQAGRGWNTVLFRMLVEKTMALSAVGAEKSDAVFSAFKRLVVLPEEQLEAVCKQLDRDWEPYPDAEQRAANIRSKTGWDRDLYENFVLKHDEFYFGSSFKIFLKNHYMSKFAAEFVRLTTEDERRDFYTEVYALNAEKDHTPINQLEHPLEALVYPAR